VVVRRRFRVARDWLRRLIAQAETRIRQQHFASTWHGADCWTSWNGDSERQHGRLAARASWRAPAWKIRRRWVLARSTRPQAIAWTKPDRPGNICTWRTKNAEMLANKMGTCRAIFVGHHAPVALGDYVAGPSLRAADRRTARFTSACPPTISCADPACCRSRRERPEAMADDVPRPGGDRGADRACRQAWIFDGINPDPLAALALSPGHLFRDLIPPWTQLLRAGHSGDEGDAPGEQPQGEGIIKLNYQRNPYPPFRPRVTEALVAIFCGPIGCAEIPPDPLGPPSARPPHRIFDVIRKAFVIGNGSDDILTIVTRAFVAGRGRSVSPTGPATCCMQPSRRFRGRFPECRSLRIGSSLSWPKPAAALTFVANPNSPTGTMVHNLALETLCGAMGGGPLLIGTRRMPIRRDNALALAKRLPKRHRHENPQQTYSLAGLRSVSAWHLRNWCASSNKVKDSYNCDALSLIGARQRWKIRTISSRRRPRSSPHAPHDDELRRFGFSVLSSQAKFRGRQRADRPVK